MRPSPETSVTVGGTAQSYLAPLLTRGQRVKYGIAAVAWIAAALFFWVWWLQPGHNIGTARYALLTFGLGWFYFMQVYFLVVFMRSRVSTGTIGELGPCRVAMVTTKTPAEPFATVRKTLEAMLAQDYPHDTWLADEDPSAETIAWCEANGVRISTRKGRPDYHRAEWPRRTRCKEGNLAFFYDHFGYENYDFVSQLDSDHVPQPGYLVNILRPFADPKVGYVSAPSICSANADANWAARTRLFNEGIFHGALQSGYSNGWAPMCIGSHYAVRTRALKQIGGLGPELAEDHSTSMIFNANGWRGVHAIDAIAYGDGPVSISDMVTQEFQWTRSLVTLLLRHTPRYLSGLTPILRFQFVFSQLWNSIFASVMLLMFLVPVLALGFDIRFADVTYPAFVGHALPGMIVITWMAFEIRRDGFFRPMSAKILSWEKALFMFIQWPWVLWGTFAAIRDRVTGGFVDFRVTPKGRPADSLLGIRVLSPYFLLALASILPVLLAGNLQQARGFHILAAINATVYTTAFAIMVIRHIRENGIPIRANLGSASLQMSSIVLLVGLTLTSLSLRGVESLHVLSIGLEPLHLTQVQYAASGAGISPNSSDRITLRIWWD